MGTAGIDMVTIVYEDFILNRFILVSFFFFFFLVLMLSVFNTAVVTTSPWLSMSVSMSMPL